MAGATPTLKIGQGFGTWLIPIIIFGVLGSAAVASLAFLVCIYSCRPRRKITDWEPETTHESYRTPTIPYKHPSHDRPVDSTIGRLVTHSRSLHVPRNQTINAHRLRPQVSSRELRNTSQPPPYPYRTTPVPSLRRHPRPQGQVYFDQIINPEHARFIPQQSQQLPPSPENLPTRPERCFSVSSPSSYSSSCMSVDGINPPYTPSIFSQESLAPARTLSWVAFSEPHQDSDSDFDNTRPLLNPLGYNGPATVSILPGHHETEKPASARPRNRSEIGGQTGHSGQNNRRLIIVDDNLVGGHSGVPSDGFTLRQVEATRMVRGTVDRTLALATANEEKKEGQVEKPFHNRDAVFKVTCPDTSDLWKLPVIRGETLDGFAGRVKQRTGVDVILFVNDEILASEEDWKASKGGGRIIARLIH